LAIKTQKTDSLRRFKSKMWLVPLKRMISLLKRLKTKKPKNLRTLLTTHTLQVIVVLKSKTRNGQLHQLQLLRPPQKCGQQVTVIGPYPLL